MKIKDLSIVDEGKVEIVGRVKNIRKHKGNLCFMTLEDHSGKIQCVIEGFEYNVPPRESIIRVNGSIVNNDSVRSGLPGREILVSSLTPLSTCYEQPSFDSKIKPKSRRIAIDNRHIYLRNPENRRIFETKSDVLKAVRDLFFQEGFLEVQSPSIVGEGVEGPVNAFRVDYFGRTAYLSLSNMLYHHILISGDLEKIFEIGKLFRQEKSHSSIHLNEFMTLDFTQANVPREGIMDLTNRLIRYVAHTLGKNGKSAVELPDVFPVIKYSELLKYLNEKGHNMSWGNMHTIGRSATKDIRSLFPSFFWIVDQPAECKSFFTAVREDEKGRLVCNDCQLWYANNSDLADGAERVIDYSVALRRIEEKGLDKNSFKYYLNSLKHGLYPCTGIGVGLERMIMTLTGESNIRDLVLFPRDPEILTP